MSPSVYRVVLAIRLSCVPESFAITTLAAALMLDALTVDSFTEALAFAVPSEEMIMESP